MLCRMAGFKPGLIFLYENLRLFREVLQVGRSCSDPQVTVMSRCMEGSSRLHLDPSCVCCLASQSLLMQLGHRKR